MPRDLYKMARKKYPDVRGLIHREDWGSLGLEKILVDTERGLVGVLRIPNWDSHRRKGSVTYFYDSLPMTRERARRALVAVYDHRLDMARAQGIEDVVEELDGRLGEAADAFLDAHPAYCRTASS